MDLLPQLVLVPGRDRARRGPAPPVARLAALRAAVASGSYRVAPERVAEAILSAGARRARRD